PIPAAEVRPGHTYRTRVRHQDSSGNWSHWSDPVQFVAGSPDVAAFQQNLVVSEFMYHPTDATPGELAAGFSNSDFEWIELQNTGPQPLDLTGVRFTKGIDFDFAEGTTIAPGDYVLLARNQAAFQLRNPTAPAVLGTFAPDKLSNSGENIKLSLGAGTAIHEFTYLDSAPWPADADGAGFSLVLNTTGTASPTTGMINHADPTNWRLSRTNGGSPGSGDAELYGDWKDTNSITSDDSDSDQDGLTAFMEFALGTDPSRYDSLPGLAGDGLQEITVAGLPSEFLTISFRRRIAAEELTYTIQFSTDLNSGTWSDGNDAILVSSSPNGDGTVTQLWRFTAPASGLASQFARLHVTS
ncbi:MAG: lamin tail domain-containing protein, partial [Verrucomicrobiales bacterium]|nr:lamin tail domain-containing protein [Verrucomicrobiales bacterium]